MGTRLELHDLLKELLGSDHAYFQPPPTVAMVYPCVVYKRNYIRLDHSNNSPYLNKKRYSVTVIDKNPDSDLPDKIAALPLCSYDRSYTADNLNHDVFNLFF